MILFATAVFFSAQFDADLGKLKWGITREQVSRDVPGISLNSNPALDRDGLKYGGGEQIKIGPDYALNLLLFFTPLSGALAKVTLAAKQAELCDPLLAEYKTRFGGGVLVSSGIGEEEWEFSDIRGNTKWGFRIFRVQGRVFGCGIDGVPLVGTSNAPDERG